MNSDKYVVKKFFKFITFLVEISENLVKIIFNILEGHVTQYKNYINGEWKVSVNSPSHLLSTMRF